MTAFLIGVIAVDVLLLLLPYAVVQYGRYIRWWWRQSEKDHQR